MKLLVWKQIILPVMLLSFFFQNISVAQVNTQSISLRCINCTVEEAVQELKTKYGFRFSYSSDVIDVEQTVSVNVYQQSLTYTLDQLFKNTGIAYKIIGDQIVLKKAPIPTPPVKPAPNSGSVPNVQKDTLTKIKDTVVVAKEQPLISPPVLYVEPREDTAAAIRELEKDYVVDQELLKQQYKHKKDSINRRNSMDKLNLRESWRDAKIALSKSFKELKDSILFSKKDTLTPIDSLKISDELAYDKFQITGAYPGWSTHGKASPYYLNAFSVNVLPGYNGAVNVLEVGLTGNILRKYSEGAQLATIFNIVQRQVFGVQMAGAFNLASMDVLGAQFAGAMNYSGGVVSGAQVAGAINLAMESMQGFQLSGGVNYNRRFLKGAQLGLINIARRIEGFQLGLINISDSIKGVPVGLISITKNGYSRFEFFASETMWGNFNYKTGVKAFYNIFHLGYDYVTSDYQRWTFGYGIGSCVQVAKRIQLNFDLIGLHVNENEAFTAVVNEQFKLNVLLGVGLTERIYLYGGPSFNTMFSEYKNAEGTIGSTMVPDKVAHTEWIHTDDKTVKNTYWVGWQFGVRF
ncbi:MAG: STN domain-containing protein [Cytophagaceae bacterium]